MERIEALKKFLEYNPLAIKEVHITYGDFYIAFLRDNSKGNYSSGVHIMFNADRNDFIYFEISSPDKNSVQRAEKFAKTIEDIMSTKGIKTSLEKSTIQVTRN